MVPQQGYKRPGEIRGLLWNTCRHMQKLGSCTLRSFACSDPGFGKMSSSPFGVFLKVLQVHCSEKRCFKAQVFGVLRVAVKVNETMKFNTGVSTYICFGTVLVCDGSRRKID